MLIDLIAPENNQSYNIHIAKMFGLDTAVYLGVLLDLNNKAIKSNKLEEGYFNIDRIYITKQTTLTEVQQKTIDVSLDKVNILSYGNNDNLIKLDIELLISLFNSEDESLYKDLSGLRKASKSKNRSEYVLNAVKNNINSEYPDELKTAYEEWLDAVARKRNGFIDKQTLFRAQDEVDAFSNRNLDVALDIIHIATSHGWPEMKYAINEHLKSVPIHGAVQARVQTNIELSEDEGDVY